MPLIANPSRTAVAEVQQESLAHWLAEGWVQVASKTEVDEDGQTSITYSVVSDDTADVATSEPPQVLPGLEDVAQAPEPAADSTPVADLNQDMASADAEPITEEHI